MRSALFRTSAVALVLALPVAIGCASSSAGRKPQRPAKPKPTSAAVVWMAPNGSDTGVNCRRFATPVANPDATGISLCATFQKTYELAHPGDTVGVVSSLGPYSNAGGIVDNGAFHWVASASYISFVPEPLGTRAADAAILALVGARHVHFQNLDFVYWGFGGNTPALAQQTQDVWMDNTTVAHFDLHSLVRFKMTRGSVGGALGCGGTPCTPVGRYAVTCPASCEPQVTTAYQAALGNQDITFDGVSFHDIGRAPGGSPHTSCLKIQSTIGLIIRNSRFWNCDSQTLMLTFDTTQTGEAWPYNNVNVLLENNWIDSATDWEATRLAGAGALDLKATNRNLWNNAAVSNWTIRNNTIGGGMYWSNDDQQHILAANVIFTGNLVRGPDCITPAAPSDGVEWIANVMVGHACAGEHNRLIRYWPACDTSLNGVPGLLLRHRKYTCRRSPGSR